MASQIKKLTKALLTQLTTTSTKTNDAVKAVGAYQDIAAKVLETQDDDDVVKMMDLENGLAAVGESLRQSMRALKTAVDKLEAEVKGKSGGINPFKRLRLSKAQSALKRAHAALGLGATANGLLADLYD